MSEPEVGTIAKSVPNVPASGGGLVRYVDAGGVERYAILAELSPDGQYADLYAFEGVDNGISPHVGIPYAEVVDGQVERVSWHY